MAALNDTLSVAYSGTDVGRIYLCDIGQRNQLGNGLGLYHKGQDCYISHGQTKTLVTTGDALMSVKVGRIKKFVDSGSLVVTL